MHWELYPESEAKDSWCFIATHEDIEYGVIVRRLSAGTFSWDAAKLATPTKFERDGTILWRSYSGHQEGVTLDDYDDSVLEAITREEINVPSLLSGLCTCTTLDGVREQVEARLTDTVAPG